MSTIYPAKIDNTQSLPLAVDNFTPITAAFINGLRSAIIAIEQNLGTNPAGIYGTVGSALSNLQSTVGNLRIITLSQDLGGTLNAPMVVGIQGRPVSNLAPAVGDTLVWNGISWIPSVGGGSGGTVVFSQDIIGTNLIQTVVGIQGRPISSAAPTTGDVLAWNGTQWIASAGGGGGDVVFSQDINGTNTQQTVIGIQGRPIVSTAPSTGQALLWNGSDWAPGTNFGALNVQTTGQIISGPLLATAVTTGLSTINGKLLVNSITAPVLSNSGQGVIYFDSTQNQFLMSQNGSSYSPFVLNYTANTFQTTGQINSGPLLATSVSTGLFTLNGVYVSNAIENPAISNAGQGIIYFDGYTNQFLVSQNGESYEPLANQDMSGDVDGTTSSATVIKIQGNSVSSNGIANDGYTLTSVSGVWTPEGTMGPVFNVKNYGAKGNGITDDTVAIQNALNALMISPNGGRLYFPAGNYIISHTLFLLGDYGHAYRIEGQLGGPTNVSTITWNGPKGCTMLDCWGVNYSVISHLNLQGGGKNLLVGGYSSPSVATLGAGCCIWFHTNQYGSVSAASLGLPSNVTVTGNAASSYNYVEYCFFGGVIGGLFTTVNLGDGEMSPGNMTVNSSGQYTLYVVDDASPPSVGVNAVDTVYSTTPTAPFTSNATSYTVENTTGFTVNRGFIVSQTGKVPALAACISSIDGYVISAVNQYNEGPGFAGTTSNSVFYNVYPNAVNVSWASLGIDGYTIVNLPFEIQNSAVQGPIFEKCSFLGGGWDTTNAGQYNYAGLAAYSGYNTELIGFRDCQFALQGGVFGVYCPTNANNEWFFDDCFFGSFSGAGALFENTNSARVKWDECGCETSVGCGYLLVQKSGAYGSATITNSECVISAICNPFYSALYFAGCPAIIQHTFFQHQYGGLGSVAQPLSISSTNGNLIVEQCWFFAEQYSPCIFIGSNDVFGSYYTNIFPSVGTNITHAFNPASNAGQLINEFPNISIRCLGNQGNNALGDLIPLPDVNNFAPAQLFSAGQFSPNLVPGVTPDYRAQVRTTTSAFELDYTQCTSGQKVFLGSLQPRTIVRGVIFEVTQTFDGYVGSLTLDCGTQGGSYEDIFTGVIVPVDGGAITNGIACNIFSQAFTTNQALAATPHFSGTLSSGHMIVYVTTEVVQIV